MVFFTPRQTYSYAKGLTLCFDLDGTLVDTAPDLVRVLNLVIAQEGLPPADYKTMRALVGYGSEFMITEACRRENHTISERRTKELRNLFLKLYADDIARLSRPYAGVINTLRGWKSAGVNMAVCTNKPGYLARPLLSALRLDIYFDRIIGGDEAARSKPDARHIWHSAGHRDANRIVMIGDAYPDIRAAHNAGVKSILMQYGYTPIAPRRLKPDKILNDFREIPSALNDLSFMTALKAKS